MSDTEKMLATLEEIVEGYIDADGEFALDSKLAKIIRKATEAIRARLLYCDELEAKVVEYRKALSDCLFYLPSYGEDADIRRRVTDLVNSDHREGE